MSVDSRLLVAFTKYLDPARKYLDNIPTSKIGLVPDAPQSAINAYEEFKRMSEEAVRQGIEL